MSDKKVKLYTNKLGSPQYMENLIKKTTSQSSDDFYKNPKEKNGKNNNILPLNNSNNQTSNKSKSKATAKQSSVGSSSRANSSAMFVPLPYGPNYNFIDIPSKKVTNSNLSPYSRESKKDMKLRKYTEDLSVFTDEQIEYYESPQEWITADEKKSALGKYALEGWKLPPYTYENEPISPEYEYMLEAPEGMYDHMLGEKKRDEQLLVSPDGKKVAPFRMIFKDAYNDKISGMSDDEIEATINYWDGIRDKADYMYEQTKDKKYKKISEMATYKRREFSGYVATKKANLTTDEDEAFKEISNGQIKAKVDKISDINYGLGPIALGMERDYSEFFKYAEKGKNNPNNPFSDDNPVNIKYKDDPYGYIFSKEFLKEFGDKMSESSKKDFDRLKNPLTDEDLNYINAIYGYYEDDPEKAEEAVDFYLNTRADYNHKKELEKNIFTRNIVAPVESISNNVFGGITTSLEGTGTQIYNAFNDEQKAVSKNSAGRQMLSSGKTARDVFIGDSTGAGYYVKSALLEAGTSMFSGLITGNPVAGQIVTSLRAMGQEIDSQLDKGHSMNKAYLTGTAQGVIEYLTEKIPMDNMFDSFKGGIKGTGKAAVKAGFIKNISKVALKNGITEIPQEASSNIAGVWADMFINGDNSDYKTYIRELMSEKGLTQEEATKEANKKFFLYDTASSSLMGFLSGSTSSSGAYAAGTIVRTTKNNAIRNKFGFNPVSGQNSVMFFDGNVMSEGRTKLNVENVKNQMMLTKNTQLNNTEASEIVNNHNDMMSKITPQILRNLNYAKKLTGGNIIVAKGDLGAVNQSLGLSETDAGNSNGYYDAPSNSIVLNFDKIGDVEYIFNTVLTHEMTHSAESSQHYEALSDYVLKDIFGDITTKEGKLALDNAIKKKISEYYKKSNGKTKLSFEGAKKEIVAQKMAEMLNDPETGYSALKELAGRDLKTARGIVNTIKDTYNRIKDKLTHNEGRYYGKYVKLAKYEEAIKLFEKAVSDGTRNKGTVINSNQNSNGVSFSFEGVTKGGIRIYKTDFPVGTSQDIKQKNFKERIATIFNLGAVTLNTGTKKIEVKGDRFTAQKNLYGDEIGSAKEKNSKINSLYDLADILSTSKFKKVDTEPSYVNPNILPKNSAHKGVKYWYKFENRIYLDGDLYDVTFNIRDKGKEQYQYLIDFKEVNKKMMPVSNTNQNGSPASAGTSPSKGMVSQNTPVVKGDNSGNLTGSKNNTQNDFTDYSKYRNGENGNTAVWDKPSDNKNGAVDNNTVEFRTKKADDYYRKAVNSLRKSLSSTFNITNLRTDSRVNDIIKAVTEKQVKNGRVDTKDIATLFEEMYSKGKVINDEAYKEYSDMRNYLRSTRMFIAREDANNIADYSDFIKRNMGSFFVSTTKSDSNVEVEAVYSELMEMHPELFSAEITHPADMLKRIAEVSRSIKKVETELSSYTGEEAEVYKEAAKQDFYAAVSAFSEKLNTLYRYENDTTASPVEVPDIVLKGTKQENATKQNNNRLASDDEINDFVEYSFKYAEETNVKGNKDFPKQQDHIRYAKVSEKLKNDILKHFGVKLKNKYHALRDNDIRHLKNSHGEGTNEKYPITKDDIKQIPDIVENYDDVLWVEKDDGKKGIIYVKRHNGVTYYLEGMLNDELLINKQMIKVPTGTIPDIKGIKDAINKKWNIVASPNDKNIPRMYVQDVWSHNVPEDSITNPTEFVKENDSTANNNRIEMTEDELINLYNEKQELQKKYEKAEKDILLSDKDKYYLEGLVRGTITEAEIPKNANIDGIKDLYQAKASVDYIDRSIERYNAIRKEKLKARAKSLLETSDTWKEKKSGFAYGRETMERNIRDMVKDKATADAIIDEYFTPVHHNEAERTRFKNKMRGLVKKLNISEKVVRGDKVSENFAVQFLGELNGDISYLESKKRLTEKDKSRLEELKAQKKQFLEDNPSFQNKEKMKKVERAIRNARRIYDYLFDEMNRVRVRNGYSPVEYRHNYFPHFITEEADGILGQMAKAIGINMDVTELPTNIAGKTQNFKPGIRYFKNAQRRWGIKTDFEFLQGFDKYIEGVSDVIYHTDDIQRLRSLESALSEKYSEKGVEDEIKALEEDTTLDSKEKYQRIKDLVEKDLTKFGGFAMELREYTNLIANKKSRFDRNAETFWRRNAYNVFNAINKNVAVNMIAGNLSSAFTNFIPLAQAKAECGASSLIKAAKETVSSYAHDDHLVNMSDFLTNRFGSDKITKTKTEKFNDALMTPMSLVDNFTSQVIWRAKYHDSIKKGMSASQAIKTADSFAAGLLADRSKGAMPTIFSARNIIAKSFTMFQVEVNNQYSYLFKDLPNAKEKKRELAAALMAYFFASYLFNDLYEKVMGRRPAFDPIGMANDFSGNTFGKKIPNTVDLLNSIMSGEKIDFDTNKKKAKGGGLIGLAEDVAENLPFVGSFIGGGRVPISSGIPFADDPKSAVDAFSLDTAKERRLQILSDELPKLAYSVLPYGGAGQAIKTIKGISTVNKGGKYTYNSKGEKKLQYPVHNDTAEESNRNYTLAALFGRNALPTAQDWVKNEFDTMSVKDTERYDMLKENGNKSKLSYNTVREISALPEAKYKEQYDYIEGSALPKKSKTDLKITYMSNAARENLEEAKKAGVSDDLFVDTHYMFEYQGKKQHSLLPEKEQKAFVKEKDKKSSSVLKRAYLVTNEDLTPEQRLAMDRILINDETKKTVEDYSDLGHFYYSELSDAQKKRLPYAQQVIDVDVRSYYYWWKKTSGLKGKKNEKISKLQEMGMDYRTALLWYEYVLK